MDPIRRVAPGQKAALARQLRREQTPAERYAWSLLRDRGILGLKFRRQHVLKGLIVDFYCAAERLVLELEGDVHERPDRQTQDAARAQLLEAAGYRVVRVKNREVTREHLEALLKEALLKQTRRSPSPHLRRGGQGVRLERTTGGEARVDVPTLRSTIPWSREGPGGEDR